MDGQLSKVAGSLNRVGAAVGAASLAAGAGLAWAGKSGLEFEEAMSKVGAVGLKSRDQIMDLEKEALRLGATTKFTATQSANAMEVMARAGFSNQEILGGVGGVLSAAAASGLEIAEVANHVSNALKGMGMEVVDSTTGMNNAARVADVLALASARTNSSIGSLGESLANVAGTASDLKVPFEDVVSAVALLQDTGLDASVAGSALKYHADEHRSRDGRSLAKSQRRSWKSQELPRTPLHHFRRSRQVGRFNGSSCVSGGPRRPQRSESGFETFNSL